MRVVVSLGGTTLLDRGERAEAAVQRRHIRVVAQALAPLTRGHDLVICYANMTQLGTLAMESENDDTLQRPYPLDVLGAQTQGMIGYWIVQELRQLAVPQPVVALITHTLVDGLDDGFHAPSAFIGPGYTRDQVQLWAGALGWKLALDGASWRRVVPHLRPTAIQELSAIRTLSDTGAVVVCGGGGGVPVCMEPWAREGLDAVVSSDLTAALLAVELDADRLLLLTDVDAVKQNFGAPHQSSRREIGVDDVALLDLPASSMGAKVDAALQFAGATNRPAMIGALRDAADVLLGVSGTTVLPTSPHRRRTAPDR